MPSNDVDVKVKAELSRLIKEGSKISGLTIEYYNFGFTSNNYAPFNKDFINFHLSAENLLVNRFGTESLYYQRFMEISKVPVLTDPDDNYKRSKSIIHLQIGILQSVLNALENGLTNDMFYERELVAFSDMLDQAYEFLDKKLLFAAGVYGRIVLETAIREYTKVKLPNSNSSEHFEQLIINLRKGGIIIPSFEKSLRANYEIGTDAAHNRNFNKYTDKDIEAFLNFIRDRVLTLK